CYVFHSLTFRSRTPPSLLSTAPLPPRPTLFPYTTLFRSHGPGEITIREGLSAAILSTVIASLRTTRTSSPSSPRRGRAGRPQRRDRKSTRLNSSHQIISYAVFCLKKKKNTKTKKKRQITH